MSGIFDLKNNKAICALPFVHQFLDFQGKQRPCCISKQLTDGRTMDDVRGEMLKGVRPKECEICYSNEDKKQSSQRIIQTVKHIKRDKISSPDCDIISIDFRNDQTCNLKCKYCGPWASTLWQKEKGMVENTTSYKELDRVDKSKLKYVYLAGGEPTLSDRYITFINELTAVNPDCEITINSNLNRLSDEWKDTIKKCNNICFIMSCEATEMLGSYLRYPLNWEKFESNVEFVVKNTNFSYFNLVGNCLNLHVLDKTINWMCGHTKNVSLQILKTPIHYQIYAIPKEHRKPYIESVKKTMGITLDSYVAYQFKDNLRWFEDALSEDNYDKSLHEALKRDILEQDNHRHISLSEADPFLYEWVCGR